MANKPTYEELEQRVLELEKTETERKQVEEPEERLKALSEASFEAIFLSEKGICLDQNQTAKKMFGYTRAEAIGRHGAEWIVPKDHEQVKINMASGYEKPYEVTALKKDGNTFPAEIQARMAEYQGRSIRITALRDISDRKQAEEALSESEEKYKSLTHNLNVGVYRNSVGSKGKFMEANPAIVKMFGYDSREEFLKIGVSDLYKDPLEREEFAFKIAKAGSIKNEILELQKKDGTEFIGSVSAVAVMNNNGDIKYFDGIIEDITERKWAEEALRESEGKYRGLIEGLDEAIYRMSLPDGKYEYMSPAAKKIFGYSAEEFIENPLIIGKLMHPDFAEYFEEKWTDLIEGKVSPTYKYKILDPEGNERWIVQSNTGIFDDRGHIIGIEGLSRDITKGVWAEEALRESEDKFRSFAEQSLVGIYLISDGVFKYVNPKFAEIFGYSVDECLDNMHFRKLVHPEDLATVEKQVGRRLSGETKAVRYSFRGIKKNGETIHVEIFGSSILLKDNTVATGTMLDITESKRAQEALRESEEKYRTILEDIEDGYFEVDIAGNLTLFNGSLCEILGYSKDELIGMNNRQFTDEGNAKELYQTFNRVYTTGKSDKGFDWKIIRKDGNKRLVEASISPKKGSEGQPIGFQGIVRDVSDRRQIEKDKAKLEARLQRAQKMEAIGALAGGVAHDLNNILGGLVSYPELLLLQLPEDSPLRKSILTIQKSGEKAAAVVQDLLTLARRGVVITDVVSLNDVIAEYLKSPEHEKLQSYHPGVHLETHLEKDALNISGSSTHLSKTVMNLLSNAAEAMPEGGTLTVSTENRYIDRPIKGYDDVKEGDYVVLTISDTGTGIASDDLNKIFEPFYTKKKMGRSGTGLGMAVVWGTVKDHNGYIDVQSTEGKGTTFILYFPVTRKKLPEDKSRLSIGSYSGNGESIMVVDDVEEQRKIASGMLEELGYSVVSISSGEEAVEYLKINKVDLLVLDMIMDPGMDGLDTYKKIINLHPGQKAIVASGFSETDRVKEVQRLGAGAYIRKPLLLEKIGLAVKEELEK